MKKIVVLKDELVMNSTLYPEVLKTMTDLTIIEENLFDYLNELSTKNIL
ncbi:hypothetical protein [Enterococcus timonensis]|nr:hypothetical protein [Enterococcus timonensis]